MKVLYKSCRGLRSGLKAYRFRVHGRQDLILYNCVIAWVHADDIRRDLQNSSVTCGEMELGVSVWEFIKGASWPSARSAEQPCGIPERGILTQARSAEHTADMQGTESGIMCEDM